MCGLIAPVLFVFRTILRGAIRPDYSQISDMVSELFSPGSANKLLLDTPHPIYALLLILFGIGLLQLHRRREQSRMVGMIGASLFIAMGILSVTTATIFPQDARGSPPAFPGELRKILQGVISLVSILSMLLMGIWSQRAEVFPRFRTYSLIIIGVILVSEGFFIANMGSSIIGLAERISILVGCQWTIVLALWMFSRRGYAGW